MSRITIHIIASCTDRKRAPADEGLLLRNVKAKSVEERANLWWDRVKGNRGPSVIASELYAGAHWSAVRKLPKIASSADYEPKLWVISAGYGLISADSFIHPYSATFAKNSPDSVCLSPENGYARREALQTWWATLGSLKRVDGIHPPTITELAGTLPDGYFLAIASPDYLSAAEADLLTAASTLSDPQRLIIVSSNGGTALKSLESYTVPSDARLQATVGGVLGSLHARVAALILENIREWGFTTAGVRHRLLELIEVSDGPKRYGREAMGDALRRSPPPSCTALLRELRGGGRACEQGRFKSLYNEVRLEGTLFYPRGD
jgi:hypothetical protein